MSHNYTYNRWTPTFLRHNFSQHTLDAVDALSLKSFRNKLNKLSPRGWVSSWTGPLNPRPCQESWPQHKVRFVYTWSATMKCLWVLYLVTHQSVWRYCFLVVNMVFAEENKIAVKFFCEKTNVVMLGFPQWISLGHFVDVILPISQKL